MRILSYLRSPRDSSVQRADLQSRRKGTLTAKGPLAVSPMVQLRLLFNFRSDPFERAQHEAGDYADPGTRQAARCTGRSRRVHAGARRCQTNVQSVVIQRRPAFFASASRRRLM